MKSTFGDLLSKRIFRKYFYDKYLSKYIGYAESEKEIVISKEFNEILIKKTNRLCRKVERHLKGEDWKMKELRPIDEFVKTGTKRTIFDLIFLVAITVIPRHALFYCSSLDLEIIKKNQKFNDYYSAKFQHDFSDLLYDIIEELRNILPWRFRMIIYWFPNLFMYCLNDRISTLDCVRKKIGEPLPYDEESGNRDAYLRRMGNVTEFFLFYHLERNALELLYLRSLRDIFGYQIINQIEDMIRSIKAFTRKYYYLFFVLVWLGVIVDVINWIFGIHLNYTMPTSYFLMVIGIYSFVVYCIIPVFKRRSKKLRTNFFFNLNDVIRFNESIKMLYHENFEEKDTDSMLVYDTFERMDDNGYSN